MISINVTLIIQMVNFLIFLTLMNLVLYRPIRRIVAERKQMIDQQQQAIDNAQAEATAAQQEFVNKIQEARKLGRQRIMELKAGGYEQEKDLLNSAGEEASKQLQEMRAKIRGDIAAARKQLKSQVQAFSADLAQKILGRKV